jgi:hypothetical protein
MTTIAILGGLLGAVFGLRFKVLILVPAILLGMIVVTATGLTRGDGTLAILLAAALVATALQLGYLGGIFTRFVMAASRAPRSRAIWNHRPISDSKHITS